MEWEYKFEMIGMTDDLLSLFNKLGRDGWELVQFQTSCAIFKRPTHYELAKKLLMSDYAAIGGEDLARRIFRRKKPKE